MISDKVNFHLHVGGHAPGLVKIVGSYHEQQPLHSEVVVVWAALTRQDVLGPFFFDGNVTGGNYLAMLKEFLWPQIPNLPNINELRFKVHLSFEHQIRLIIESDGFHTEKK